MVFRKNYKMKLTIPEGYQSVLNVQQTEQAIKLIKDFFQENLAAELRLRRVTAPLFVKQGTGINDDLNGIERPVSFPMKDLDEERAEIVQSLAKWKRMALADLKIEEGFGLYTDMNAIRPDEELTKYSLPVCRSVGLGTCYFAREQRNLDFLKAIVRKIYSALVRTEFLLSEAFPVIKAELPEEITFIHTEELAAKYPDLTPFERETTEAQKTRSYFRYRYWWRNA